MELKYKLIFDDKKYELIVDYMRAMQVLPKIPQEIGSKLLKNEEYTVKSQVSLDVFQGFLDYWKDSKEPEINSNNYYEYYLLNQEFCIMTDYLTEHTNKDDFHISDLKCLSTFSDNNSLLDKSDHERYIALHLDSFLEKYEDQMLKIPINSLYNIFFHKERVLNDQQKAFYFINKNKNKNPDLLILLPSLDAEQLNHDEVINSISTIQENIGFIPHISPSIFRENDHHLSTNSIQDFIVDIKDFILENIICEESTCRVFKCKNKNTGNYFAAHIYSIRSIMDQKNFFTDINVLSQMKNPAVLGLIGISLIDFNYEMNPIFITKFMKNQSLEFVFYSIANLSKTQIYIILLGIAEGMKYLHSKKIVHRNLNPTSILLDENYYPYITGQCKMVHYDIKHELMQTITNNRLNYMAPEIMSGEYTNKIDVYSFSLIAYQLITGKNPFHDMNFKMIVQYIDQGNRPPLDIIPSEEVRELLKKCWSKNPDERPSFKDITNEIKRKSFQEALGATEEDEINKYLELFDK